MALSINTELSKFDIPTSNTGGCLAQEFESYCLLGQQIRLQDNFKNEKIQTSNGGFRKEKIMCTTLKSEPYVSLQGFWINSLRQMLT